jgi:hypothetical protein
VLLPLITELKRRFPKQVVLLRGTHEVSVRWIVLGARQQLYCLFSLQGSQRPAMPLACSDLSQPAAACRLSPPRCAAKLYTVLIDRAAIRTQPHTIGALQYDSDVLLLSYASEHLKADILSVPDP